MQLKLKNLVYLCSGIGSVFDSQVLELLRAINEKDAFEKIFLFLGISSEKEKKEFQKRKISDKIVVRYFKSYPNYFFFNFLQRKSIREAIININCHIDSMIFHSRGELIAWHLRNIIDLKYHRNIIPDIRGASIEEIEEFYNLNKFQKVIKIYNNMLALQNLNNYAKISVVSDSLKGHVVHKYNVKGERIYIIPSLAGNEFSFIEEQRKGIRLELKLNDEDLLIVFSTGGTANWQNNSSILMLAEKGLKILNLSKKEIPHKNIINKFVSYAEMPLYLNAADVAIIWRDKSIVNEVASPVKFSEYVCCGLPVIANPSVDVITDYINNYECGILVDNIKEIDLIKLEKLKSMNRKKISEDGIKNFGNETIVNQYLQIYSINKE